MRIDLSFSWVFFIFILLNSTLSYAQNNGTIANPSGGLFNLNPEKKKMIQDGLLWTIRRVDHLKVETIFNEMKKDGIAYRQFGLTASGALINNEDWHARYYNEPRDTPKEMDLIGRDSGLRLFPYQVTLMLDPSGTKRMSFSAIAFRNMNDFARVLAQDNEGFLLRGQGNGFFSYVNQLEFLNFTWDQNYSFNDMKSFEINIYQTEVKYNLVGNERYGVNLRGYTDGGFGKLRFTQEDGQRWTTYKQEKASAGANTTTVPTKEPSPQWSYQYGLELNSGFKNGDRLKIQTHLRGGSHRFLLQDPQIISENVQKNEFKNTLVKNKRNYLYFSGHASYSSLINRNQTNPDLAISPDIQRTRPVRLGLELDLNIPIRDQLKKTPSAVNYNPANEYRRIFTGRIFLKF